MRAPSTAHTRTLEPRVRDRWPPELLERRLERERRKRAHEEPAPFPLNLFKRSLPYKVLNRFLKVTGLYERGHRSYLSPELRYTEIRLPRLPAAFDGLRILHLVDLHLDLCPALADIVRGIIAPLDYDLCLVTGDFRDSLIGPGLKGVELSAELLREIQRPVFGSLGNHDLASDVPLLEASGMRLLINEHTWLERDGQRLYIAGIDDSAYMGAYDVDAALGGIPDGACIVLLSHAPDAYIEAAARDVDFMLSGHTHGGQICLPNGRPLLTHSDSPRKLVRGHWTHGRLQGYTSGGAGACRVAARYFCPGEINIHTLRRAE